MKKRGEDGGRDGEMIRGRRGGWKDELKRGWTDEELWMEGRGGENGGMRRSEDGVIRTEGCTWRWMTGLLCPPAERVHPSTT